VWQVSLMCTGPQHPMRSDMITFFFGPAANQDKGKREEERREARAAYGLHAKALAEVDAALARLKEAAAAAAAAAPPERGGAGEAARPPLADLLGERPASTWLSARAPHARSAAAARRTPRAAA